MTLDDVVMLARAYLQCEVAPPLPPPTQACSTATSHFSKPPGATPPPQPQLSSTASASSVAKPAPTIKCLSPAEIAQRHKDRQCFHCDEFFTIGHKLVCKQLFCIQVLDEDEVAASQDPTISIHGLTAV
jgi:hypothetical protein